MASCEASESPLEGRVTVLVPRDPPFLSREWLGMPREATWDSRDLPRVGREAFGDTREGFFNPWEDRPNIR